MQVRRGAALAVFLVMLAGLGLPAAHAAEAPPLRMVYTDNMPPVGYQEQGQMRGAWVAVMDELAQRLHLTVQHQGFPWARAQVMVSTGAADGMITVASPERLRYALAGKQSVLDNDTRIYAHKSNARMEELAAVQGMPDLRKFRVISYLGNNWLKSQLSESSKVRWLRTLDDAVRATLLEENAVLVEGERLMLPVLRRRQLEEEFVAVGPVLAHTSSRLLIARQSPYAARMADFDKALAAMHRDGTMKQILARYGMD